MGYESSTSLKAREKIRGIQQKRKFYTSIPVLTALAPFIPAGVPVVGGFLAGIANAYLSRDAKEAVVDS